MKHNEVVDAEWKCPFCGKSLKPVIGRDSAQAAHLKRHLNKRRSKPITVGNYLRGSFPSRNLLGFGS